MAPSAAQQVAATSEMRSSDIREMVLWMVLEVAAAIKLES